MRILRNSKKNSPVKTLLMIGLGIALLAVSYIAVKNSTEQRSKAAQTERTVKAWEFNGTSTEGWKGEKLKSLKALDGTLQALTGTKVEPFIQVETNAPVPNVGITKFKIQIAVSGESGPVSVAGGGGSDAVVPPTRYKFNLSYRLKGKSSFEKPLVIQGAADGNMYTQELQLPTFLVGGRGTKPIIDRVRIDFGKSGTGKLIKIDWIRVINLYELKQPTPRDSQKVQLKGVISQTNLEGKSLYLITDQTTRAVYQLAPVSAAEKYVGQCVAVEGSVSSNEQPGYVGIPTGGQNVVRVGTISPSEGCEGGSVVRPTVTPTPGGRTPSDDVMRKSFEKLLSPKPGYPQ